LNKTACELGFSGVFCSSYSTNDTRLVTVNQHEHLLMWKRC
jgi:hypothetical protein